MSAVVVSQIVNIEGPFIDSLELLWLSASEALAPILRFSIGIVFYGEYLTTARISL